MHPLLNTTRRSAADVEAAQPKEASYDFQTGMWHGANGPLCDDPSAIPASKKADMETGEDQKGQ